MNKELHNEMSVIFIACRGREEEMRNDDRTFFMSLSNKFSVYGHDLDLSDEQVTRLRNIRVYLHR